MSGYRFIDWATQAYNAFVAVVIVGVHNDRFAPWPWLLAGHAAVAVLVHVLARSDRQPARPAALRLLREFLPILLYTAFYNETGPINRLIGAAPWDARLTRIEHSLFGFQPSVRFMEAAPWLPFSELMHAAYFSYYLMIAGLGVWFLFRQAEAFRHFVAVVSFVFYACYAAYLFIPAVGPRAFFENSEAQQVFLLLYGHAPSETPPSLTRGPFFQVIAFFYRYLETWGAAFPSSHVAVALTTAWFTWRYLPKLRWLHATAAVLLCASTVYGRFHYAIDVLAGALACAILLPVGNVLYMAAEARKPRQGNQTPP